MTQDIKGWHTNGKEYHRITHRYKEYRRITHDRKDIKGWHTDRKDIKGWHTDRKDIKGWHTNRKEYHKMTHRHKRYHSMTYRKEGISHWMTHWQEGISYDNAPIKRISKDDILTGVILNQGWHTNRMDIKGWHNDIKEYQMITHWQEGISDDIKEGFQRMIHQQEGLSKNSTLTGWISKDDTPTGRKIIG